jgi:hypothetical protein
MLEVVQQQQYLPVPQVLDDRLVERGGTRFLDAERGRHHTHDMLRLAERGQGHEGDAVGEGVGQRARDAQRQPGLADAPRVR